MQLLLAGKHSDKYYQTTVSVKITRNSLHLEDNQSFYELVSSLCNKMDTKISLYYHTVGRLSQSAS